MANHVRALVPDRATLLSVDEVKKEGHRPQARLTGTMLAAGTLLLVSVTQAVATSVVAVRSVMPESVEPARSRVEDSAADLEKAVEEQEEMTAVLQS